MDQDFCVTQKLETTFSADNHVYPLDRMLYSHLRYFHRILKEIYWW